MAATRKTPEIAEKFTVDALRASCVKIFGCSTAVFDGAMADKSKTENYSRDEVKAFIDAFLSKKLGGK